MQFSLIRLLRHQPIIGALSLFLLGWSLSANASEEALQDYRNTFPQLSDSQLLNRVGAGDRLAELELAIRLSEGRGTFVEKPTEALLWCNRAARQGVNARELAGSLSVTVDQLPLPVVRNVGVDGTRGGVHPTHLLRPLLVHPLRRVRHH